MNKLPTPLDLDLLLQFIDEQNKYLRNMYNHTDHKVEALAQVAKTAEEFGELTNEVLHSLRIQRQSKLKSDNKEELAAEVADVLICTLLLANTLGVDAKAALEAKITKILGRRESGN